MGFLRWLADNGNSWQALAGAALVLLGMCLLVLWLSWRFNWAATPEETYRGNHRPAWYRVRQRDAGELTARLRVERVYRELREQEAVAYTQVLELVA